jgi:hypothetical protein
MPKPFIPPMKGNKTPFQPAPQPKGVQRPTVNTPKPVNRRPANRGT